MSEKKDAAKAPAKKKTPKAAQTKAAAKDKTKPASGGKKAATGSPAAKAKTPKRSTAKKPAKAKPAKAEPPAKQKEAEDTAPSEAEQEKEETEAYVAKAKPDLDDEIRAALRERAEKKARNPAFRRHEWWRYKRLGGKHAPWRKPRGIHSKQRRHFGYRPPVVSIGYRTPATARGLHPSGFEEVLVHRPADLEGLDPKRQAARIGRTVGGRKADAIQSKADELGVRILNRRDV